jgi:hypothetical protein
MVFHGCPVRKLGVTREPVGDIFGAGTAVAALNVPAAAFLRGENFKHLVGQTHGSAELFCVFYRNSAAP